ncbi:A-kinase anchor protein 8-like [Bufo gargarizans]|uniref:A-kinase anchor protein 8-like n=1 Tax=Bufo gargarizans TaxID=30331 RepID=UPI001CF2ECD4|nr:A-kinase anchor protein 8-like [Bufo gargarizans]
MRSVHIRKLCEDAEAMDARFWGRPGFNFPRPWNYPGPVVNYGPPLGDPRFMHGPGMEPRKFPPHMRPPVRFNPPPWERPKNPNMHGNAFGVRPPPFDPTQMQWRPMLNRKRKFSTLRQFPNMEQTGTYASQTYVYQAKTQNGDVQEHTAAGETSDANSSNQEHKKAEDSHLLAEQPNVNSYGWQGDTSTMFSCVLCQYYTPDEKQIQIHFFSCQHTEIIKHLSNFFPEKRVNFLNEYLMFKKNQMALQKKNSNLKSVKDTFKGVIQDQYLSRVQATYCQACDVFIPDATELLKTHIKSDVHKQNRKVRFKTVKASSLATAKNLLQDKDILQMHVKYIKGQNPFKDLTCSSQVSGSPEILVPEEDDNDNDDDNDGDDDIVDDILEDTNDEDSIANVGYGEELPVYDDENTDTDLMFLLSEQEMIETDPMIERSPSMTVKTEGKVKGEGEEEEAAEAP